MSGRNRRQEQRWWTSYEWSILHYTSSEENGNDGLEKPRNSAVERPGGSILTAFGTGYRVVKPEADPQTYCPRDVGLVKWRVNDEGLNDDRAIANAPFDSDLRSLFDPLL